LRAIEFVLESPRMFDGDMVQIVEQAAHEFLLWVGFGTVVGLCAKAIMPGRDPGGSIVTMLMGIGGAVIGCGVMYYYSNGERVTPISMVGFPVAIAGAFILLIFYRLMSGSLIVESQDGDRVVYRRERRRRGRVVYE